MNTIDTIGRVPAFSFEEKSFLLLDGGLVERKTVEAVKQWFELMLRQQPGKIPIYRTGKNVEPGVDRSLLKQNLPFGYLCAEIERQVRATATYCPAVQELDCFAFTRLKRGLQVAFTARLYSEEAVEVSVYVE